MVGSIMISKLATFSAKMFLQQRVDDDLFACGVMGNFPGELPTHLSVNIALGGSG